VLSDIPVHREFHEGAALFFNDESELLEILKQPLAESTFSNYTDSSLKALSEIIVRVKSML
jgi:hypothetical protein